MLQHLNADGLIELHKLCDRYVDMNMCDLIVEFIKYDCGDNNINYDYLMDYDIFNIAINTTKDKWKFKLNKFKKLFEKDNIHFLEPEHGP